MCVIQIQECFYIMQVLINSYTTLVMMNTRGMVEEEVHCVTTANVANTRSLTGHEQTQILNILKHALIFHLE